MGRKASITFGHAFSLYADYAKQRLKSHHEIVGIRQRYLQHLDVRHLAAIKRLEIIALHNEIGTAPPEAQAGRKAQMYTCWTIKLPTLAFESF